MIRGFAPGIFDGELRSGNTTDASGTSQRRKSQSLYLVSGFRIHQVRVRSVDCRGTFSAWLCASLPLAALDVPFVAHECVVRALTAYLDGTKCFPEYAEDVEETAPFRPGNGSTWYWLRRISLFIMALIFKSSC